MSYEPKFPTYHYQEVFKFRLKNFKFQAVTGVERNVYNLDPSPRRSHHRARIYNLIQRYGLTEIGLIFPTSLNIDISYTACKSQVELDSRMDEHIKFDPPFIKFKSPASFRELDQIINDAIDSIEQQVEDHLIYSGIYDRELQKIKDLHYRAQPCESQHSPRNVALKKEIKNGVNPAPKGEDILVDLSALNMAWGGKIRDNSGKKR